MKRDIINPLKNWKNSKNRKPLIIRGARQVGKTYTINDFGKKYFTNVVEINLEQRKDLKNIFSSLKPLEIINTLSIITGQEIIPGKTLLFIDEIQEDINAIISLRYFYEQMPALHVIAAGSLLEFAVNKEKISFPVGRIDFLFMYPLSFLEFLEALNKKKLRKFIETISLGDDINPAIELELTSYLKQYFIIGGMPEAVKSFSQKYLYTEVSKIQSSILNTYEMDFYKYGFKNENKYLQEVFINVPKIIGKICKYSYINPDYQSRDIKKAILSLQLAGVLKKIKHSSGHKIPLESQSNEKKFKLLFLDVGLMQKTLGLSLEITTNNDFMNLNLGNVAEQFIGQELLTENNIYEKVFLHFWIRDKKSSCAEVDYLVSHNNDIYPLEVKSGKLGKLKSLYLFLKEHPLSKFGLRFSSQEFSYQKNVLSLPLYMISQWRRFCASIIER